MEGYFDNLAAAAMNDQSTLAEMVRAMSNLTKRNEVLTKTNAALTYQVTMLQKAKGPNNPSKPRNGAGGNLLRRRSSVPTASKRSFTSQLTVSNCR